MSKTLTRTICIKLDVDGHETTLAATQCAFNAATSWIARVCWEEGITNTHTAQHRVYGETRLNFGLGAQLAVCAITHAASGCNRSLPRTPSAACARTRAGNTVFRRT